MLNHPDLQLLEKVGLSMRHADHHFLEGAVETWFEKEPSPKRLAIIEMFLKGYWANEPRSQESQKAQILSKLENWRTRYK